MLYCKYMNKFFYSAVLGVALFSTQSVQAADPVYVATNDIQAVNETMQSKAGTYCPLYWSNDAMANDPVGYAAYQSWVNGLRLVSSQPIGGYNRYPVAFKGRTVSMVLPYDASWSFQGKQVRPYLLTGDRTADVGQLDFINISVQEDTCEFGRPYSLTLKKGTIKTIEADLKREQATLRADGASTDTSQHVPTVMLGASMALVPSVLENSGGYTLQYDRVSVNLRGGWVLTIRAKGGNNATVDTNMLRMAASAR